MITLLTTADTEILAVRRAAAALPAGFPAVQARNPTAAPDPLAVADEVVDAGAAVVLVRLLGGRRAWPEGFDRLRARCAQAGIPLLAFSGEETPDAELTAASTAPAGLLAEAFEYLVHGGVGNLASLLRFVADTLLATGFGFDPPEALPEDGEWHPAGADRPALDPAAPTVGVVFYRTHWMSGNTDFVAALVEALEAAGVNALPVFCYSLRPRAETEADQPAPAGATGQTDPFAGVPALRRLDGRVDAVLVSVLAMGGANAGDAVDEDWQVPALRALDVPVVQALCATTSRGAWADSDAGLSPLDAAMQVAIPEFDGRIVTVPVSFKELDAEGVPRYVPDDERAARAAGITARLARLRRLPAGQRRIAVVLSNYPTRHSRVGNAVGLDTPASAALLLDALTAEGYDTGDWSAIAAPEAETAAADERVAGGAKGDWLVHELIATGGFDPEFLSGEELGRSPARLDVERYAAWFARLPADLQARVTAHWGPPPGELYVADGALAFAAREFGNVVVAIQPPRGFGDDPVAIYHDPDLPPTHHYLACYWWVEAVFGADAVVHLGKHGTLEWLPGKSLGLSASCAPDAVLGDLPLVYPFVVNDPGEGTQAKRRAHAVIVDHLVPPLTRADTYDDLARLEQLLDEYFHIQAMDPGKQQAIRGEIWQLLRATELTRDLGLDDRGEHVPDDLDDLLVDVDGYLCELKDLQIRGGLHVLGEPPDGEARIDLVLALLRLPQPVREPAGTRTLPGLRAAVAATFGLVEAELLDAPGRPVAAPETLLARFPGPGHTGADLLDRLEEAARALVTALAAHDWDPDAAEGLVTAELGVADAEVAAVLGFAAAEVAPRLAATRGELPRICHGLAGGFVPSGPSGSPSRGRLDVLPTGKNFYSVDPKAVPSELSWQVGQRLAEDLLRGYLDEEGAYPRAVGIVVWGTAAMRTHGDDIAEILALLGVRPIWDAQTRRVTGLELIDVAELGRPRVDVTVRISGFFRDAFPHLVRLVDDAVAMVAALDEPEHDNPIAAHVRADVAEGVAERAATARIFGSKPGAYGAGLLPLIDARNWHSDADLAEVYSVWGGYAYGRDLDGVAARGDMERAFTRLQVAVKNVDTREHDLVDADDYFQYHGGMVATVRALTGSAPKAMIGDSADPARVRTRGLREEVARVFRARVANPKWITAMQRHGYKGAFELSATVDYLFGYDATAEVVEDWMYEQLAARYVADPDTRAFLAEANPWALRAITERLLEAADRGLWAEPQQATLDALRAEYLALEGDLEQRHDPAAASPQGGAHRP